MTNANSAKLTASIDPQEVDYYTRFAETWWDQEGPFWPLHALNAVRTPFIRDEVTRQFAHEAPTGRPLTGLTILDVGCGGGILAESMARLGAEVTGIDVVERNLQVARAHAAGTGLDIDYRDITAESLAATGATFDVVLNMEVVEHVADLDGFMAACCALVRPDGMMFVATINRTWLAWLVAIFGAEYVLRWMPKGTHRYGLLRRPGEIASRLASGGLQVGRTTGVAVNPLRKRLFLTPITRVNYMLSAHKDAGDDAGEGSA